MDRSDILEQLSTGQLSADEAARLLRTGQPLSGGAPAPARDLGAFAQRRLRVRVSNLETGRDRVNVNVPFALVEAGLKLGARYEPKIASLDVGEIFEQLEAGTQGKIVDVENWEDGERVEIFIE